MGRVTPLAEKSCQISRADSRHPRSPFVLHPLLSVVSVLFRDLQQYIRRHRTGNFPNSSRTEVARPNTC
ncbi:hypothetical protein LSAT2_009559 [Lamellibrachia satsuma]|nr:hypothetical protein LSAT2_009559 [Lamellibrachia satsuma]